MGKWITRPAGRAAAVLAGWMLLAVAPALAVTPGQVSWTAEGVAALRAIAAQDPDPKIRCPDHLAEKFVTADFWRYSPYAPDYDTAMKVVRAYKVGTYYFLNARTHFIDDILVRMAEDGLTQAVSLGAGLDTRAYRFSRRYPKIRFFELDLPGNSALKQEMVRARFGKLPNRVVFIAVDPEADRLDSVLRNTGYDETQPTLFFWTGATYHLSAAAVEATLDVVARHAAAGSRIVFDYIPEPILADPASRRARFRLALAGEPLIFGIPEEGVAAYLPPCGLSIVSDLGWRQLQQQYLVGRDGTVDGTPSPLYRVAVAEVVSRAAEPAKADAPAKQKSDDPVPGSLSGTWTGRDSLGGRLVFRFSPGGESTAQRTGGRDPRPKKGADSRAGSRIEGRMGDIIFFAAQRK